MSIMDLVRKWKENKKQKSEKFKELQEDYRLQKMLEERQKSANQRELESYYKEQREKQIKEELDEIRKQKKKEMWHGNNFAGKSSILRNERPILKEKNIFKGCSKCSNLKSGGFLR